MTLRSSPPRDLRAALLLLDDRWQQQREGVLDLCSYSVCFVASDLLIWVRENYSFAPILHSSESLHVSHLMLQHPFQLLYPSKNSLMNSWTKLSLFAVNHKGVLSTLGKQLRVLRYVNETSETTEIFYFSSSWPGARRLLYIFVTHENFRQSTRYCISHTFVVLIFEKR